MKLSSYSSKIIDKTDIKFFKQVASDHDLDYKAIQKYYEAIYSTLTQQLYLNDRCYLPMIGNFITIKNQERTVCTSDGEVYIIPAHKTPTFKRDDRFVDDINLASISSTARKRLKSKKVSKVEIRRQVIKRELEQFKQRKKTDFAVAKTNFAEELKKMNTEFEAAKEEAKYRSQLTEQDIANKLDKDKEYVALENLEYLDEEEGE